ncbi:hypothetical protein RVU96_16795 [Bordetella avium]|uniref:hypothetical protein n=1 Tax=Bordetella avium TaxID=521 RepID=UPI000E0AD0C1|nr:hypothetical protein [Bordetella avium]RIQ11572.1 hypothetical protein D0432_16315 [Bordetella avium]RIQ44929.1 hypothetical protein D0845_17125 [Bordetella avium]RIQ49579.1 hypothetical protein D0844_16420 [Bordetella avium]RIQ55324.1 hypothetical protein D0841_16530 [Bordetella avium]RIQ58424.1 hypothetical protein D0842_16515 [Bordetella avium]
MPEVNSAQAQKMANRKKLMPAESHGRQRVLVATLTDGHPAYPVGTTILLGHVPVNSRFLAGAKISVAGGGTASSTLAIGIRKLVTQEVIDAEGLAVAAALSAAATVAADTGALIAGAADYITPVDVEVFATVKGAELAAGQRLRVEVPYVTD